MQSYRLFFPLLFISTAMLTITIPKFLMAFIKYTWWLRSLSSSVLFAVIGSYGGVGRGDHADASYDIIQCKVSLVVTRYMFVNSFRLCQRRRSCRLYRFHQFLWHNYKGIIGGYALSFHQLLSLVSFTALQVVSAPTTLMAYFRPVYLVVA